MNWNKNFTLLLTGQSLANMGDVLYMVSVISTIFVLTESATAASFVPFTITSAMFVSSLLTPLLIGKVNLNWLMAGTQIGKTFLLVLLGVILIGLSASDFYWIYVLIGLIAFLDGCANPISQTLIPHYVKPEDLVQANGITETVAQILQALMWFIGSLFLLVLNPPQLVWLVGVLFAISSSLLCFLESVNLTTKESKGKLEQIKEGWRTLADTKVLRKIGWINLYETLASTVWIAAILLVFVSDALHTAEKWWGFINGAFFAGLILGSIYCIKYFSFIERKLSAFIFAGSFAGFLATILFSLNSVPSIALVLSFIVGISVQLKSIPQQTVIQTSVPKERLATVYTSLGAIGTGVFGIGSLVMGFLADLLGVRFVFIISGLLLMVVSVIVNKNNQLFVRNLMEP
ncbi:MFS transporter [Bacillus sp. ISL-39]|uniref:MFS transporter n=1 Tax=Bacillus sp. ISL-39 TaxID=2819124 RepID=UPI001BE546A3|nr:MFS transporter [Bacillus sp. ISL-39]MBT2640393.1 MFS transporter [Bacillus sp. ISL-39]